MGEYEYLVMSNSQTLNFLFTIVNRVLDEAAAPNSNAPLLERRVRAVCRLGDAG